MGNLGQELAQVAAAYVPPPFEEREVLTEEDQWALLVQGCRERASYGCTTFGFTLVTGIENEHDYAIFTSMKERFRARLAEEGVTMDTPASGPYVGGYYNLFAQEWCPTTQSIHFVVSWRGGARKA